MAKYQTKLQEKVKELFKQIEEQEQQEDRQHSGQDLTELGEASEITAEKLDKAVRKLEQKPSP